MRFLSLLANVSSFYYLNRPICANYNRLLPRNFGSEGDKLDFEAGSFRNLPLESDRTSNASYNDYIKKLEIENQQLNEQLKQSHKLIKCLNEDMSQMQSDRLYCMIYEAYQRFKAQIGQDHDDSGKIDVFLEAVKKGKLFTDDKMIHWMINFESSEPGQLLKEFRNDYSHYTSNDVAILRQWRAKLIKDSSSSSSALCDRNKLNDAAVNILNVVIDHLNRPQARPLLRKNSLTGKNPAKPMNKMERKRKDRKTARTNQSKQEKVKIFQLFQWNAARIAQLRKSVKAGDMRAFEEVRMLRAENQKLIKRYGTWLIKITKIKLTIKTKKIINTPPTTHFKCQEKMSGRGGLTAIKRLMNEFKEINVNPPEGIFAGPISEDNYFVWEAMIAGPPGTAYEGGVFPALLTFPKDYPLSPPSMKFTCELFHPNIYPDGRVCISILHPPGDDPNQYESSSERWSPVQSVEKILLSVVSMLAEPNDESGANIDACKLWRSDREKFNEIVRGNVKKSLGME